MAECVDTDSDQLDSYMIPFEPYKKKGNPKHTFENGSKTLFYFKMSWYLEAEMKKEFHTKILLWLKKEVSSLKDPVIIVIAPGHEKNPNPAGFMHDIVGELLADGKINGNKQLLIRTKTVQKQAGSTGPRTKETHRGTIEIKGSPIPDNSGSPIPDKSGSPIPDKSGKVGSTIQGKVGTTIPDNSGKVVIILDDVWTSGCTLGVCKEVMLTTKPKEVKLFAIGKTV